MSQNFQWFHVSNLSVLHFRIFPIMSPGSPFRLGDDHTVRRRRYTIYHGLLGQPERRWCLADRSLSHHSVTGCLAVTPPVLPSPGDGLGEGGKPPAVDCGRGVFSGTLSPYTWAEKFESFERINSIRETNGNFDSCNSCKRLGTSRLHELHESKLPFVSRIEFIRSKLSNFSAHVYGVAIGPTLIGDDWPVQWPALKGSVTGLQAGWGL